MNNLKLNQKSSLPNLNTYDSKTDKIKSHEKLLKTQIDRMLTDSNKKIMNNINNLSDTHFSAYSPKNQKTFEEESEFYSPNISKMQINGDLAQKIYVRKLIYDNKKMQQQFEKLKKSYDELQEECKIVKEQNEKLSNFMKQKINHKMQNFHSAQIFPTVSKLTTKHSMSIAKFQKSSHHHKQKNAILQYTVDQLIKKVGEEWAKLVKKTKELKNMDDILGNSSQFYNNDLQEMQQMIQKQKLQMERLSDDNRKLSVQLIQYKQLLEIYNKQSQQQLNKKILKLEQQNKLLRQQIVNFKKDFQTQEEKLQNIIRIASERSYLSTRSK